MHLPQIGKKGGKSLEKLQTAGPAYHADRRSHSAGYRRKNDPQRHIAPGQAPADAQGETLVGYDGLPQGSQKIIVLIRKRYLLFKKSINLSKKSLLLNLQMI